MLAPRHRALLEAVPLFQGIAPAATRLLANEGTARHVAAGAALWTAGGDAQGLWVVLEGRVRVVRAPRGRQHAIHEEVAGGTLGEVPLFAEGRYPATAIAAEPVLCLVLTRATLHRAVAADPELAFRLLGALARRVRSLVDRLDRRTLSTVEQRVAAHLLACAGQAARSGDATFRVGRTQGEAAEEVGTVREVLVRTLRRLRDAGAVVQASRGRYRIADARALRRLANDMDQPGAGMKKRQRG